MHFKESSKLPKTDDDAESGWTEPCFVSNSTQVGPAVDVYAFGILLNEMFPGACCVALCTPSSCALSTPSSCACIRVDHAVCASPPN